MPVASKPAQDFVPIKEVRDGVLILNDGSMRGIVLASSVNFALKSADEQQAILFQFQDFLNSLDFSVQFFVESRRLDIRPYLAVLENRYRVETADLLKIQIHEYIEFVRSFTENTNIMTKSFFVVVPYTPAFLTGKGGAVDSFFARFRKKEPGAEAGKGDQKKKTDSFEENRVQLEQRIGIVQQGLVRCGVRVIPLGSEEIIELFYKIFNPGETDKPISMAK